MIIKAIVAMETFRDAKIKEFREDESGLALTEYLVLLGLLVGGVIAGVTLFGGNLNTTWNGWAGWITRVVTAPAAATGG